MHSFRLGLITTAVISSTCFTVAAQERSTQRLADERARQIVRAMDRNRDGVVSRAEFEAAMSQRPVSAGSTSVSTDAAERPMVRFERLDANRDDVLDVSEIKAGIPLPYTIR